MGYTGRDPNTHEDSNSSRVLPVATAELFAVTMTPPDVLHIAVDALPESRQELTRREYALVLGWAAAACAAPPQQIRAARPYAARHLRGGLSEPTDC